jgi:small redox-active disulfide protein 2
MKIYVAGPGCPRCKETHKNVLNALAELNIAADVEYVTDIKEYAKLGVMMTPAVIVDGKVVVSGKIPTVNELKTILKNKKGQIENADYNNRRYSTAFNNIRYAWTWCCFFSNPISFIFL